MKQKYGLYAETIMKKKSLSHLLSDAYSSQMSFLWKNLQLLKSC